MGNLGGARRKSPYDYVFVSLVSLSLLAYEIARAGKVALTFDEAATYLNYFAGSALSLFDFSVANNHFLNTVLARLSSLLFGMGELALRLPNLLAFGLYLFFAFRLTDRFARRAVALPGFLLLTLNPYLLDFFSLSRGYGLSLAFLVAALYYFLRFFERELPEGAGDPRDLAKAAGAAGLAVMANFTLLLAYVSLVLVAAVACVVRNAGARARPAAGPETARGRMGSPAIWVPIALAAAVFNILVALHDFRFASRFFAGVQVRVHGLTTEEAGSVRVLGIGGRNREFALPYENGGWTLPERIEYLGLELVVPSGLRDRIRDVELVIGSRDVLVASAELAKREQPPRAGYRAFLLGPDIAVTRSKLPGLRPAINWRGDGLFFLLIAKREAVLAGLAALAVLAVVFLGRLLVRAKLLTRRQFNPLAGATLVLAAFAAYPVVLLKTGGELYWGGGGGFLSDTVRSLIEDTFYGRLYFKGEILAFGLLVTGVMLAFVLWIAVRRRRREPAGAAPAILVLAVLAAAAGGSLLLRIIFSEPSLMNRTALFFIPVTAAFCVLAAESLARAGRIARIGIPVLLALAALAAAGHFAATANTVMTVEWRTDADNKAVLADLESLKDREFPGKAKIRFGVDWIYLPSLTYYIERRSRPWLDLAPFVDRPENDVYYLGEAFDPARMILLKRYAASDAILVKPKP